jgi:hypothetical protein
LNNLYVLIFGGSFATETVKPGTERHLYIFVLKYTCP